MDFRSMIPAYVAVMPRFKVVSCYICLILGVTQNYAKLPRIVAEPSVDTVSYTHLMLNIKIERAKTLKEKPKKGEPLGFGHIFTDHMFVMNYTEGIGCLLYTSL